MKIGLYGGSFNPVHNEHVNIARRAVETLNLDKLIILPTFITPNKSGDMPVRGRERAQMCRIAFADIAQAEVSDYEIKRGGVSYSYITCRHFRKIYPDDELYFIMGADMLKNFPEWSRPEEILKCVTLAVCAREDRGELIETIRGFGKKYNTDIAVIDYIGGAVSSTKIRTLAALGEDISPYVPPEVKDYIVKNGLYIRNELCAVKKYLTESRWEHTVRVALFAAENCNRAGVTESQAVTAAAMHDCAKYLDLCAPELEGFLPPPDVPPPVLHQYSGAYVAEHTFGVTDKTILNAIACHTSGKENMNGLEKLLFLSDMLEEGRDFEGVKKLRKIFGRNMDEALYAALKEQLDFLKSSGKSVYPLTRRAFESLRKNQ